MCVHWAILHWTTHFLLHHVYKNILDISVFLEYLFREGDSLFQFNEGPAPPVTKKHHRDSSFDGDQRKHDLAASPSILQILDPWVWSLTLSFQSTRIPQREFPSFQGDPSKMFCFNITVSNLNRFLFILFWACSQYYSRHFCFFRIFYFSGGMVLFCY